MPRREPRRALPARAVTPLCRVVLVRDANHGLGFKLLRQLSERGMTALPGALDMDKDLHLARNLSGAAHEVLAVQLYVKNQDPVDTLRRWNELTYGRLNVLATM